ncbi:hypothetical protein CDD82_7429 [Ophiocordyceps australis]|uniref:Zn(2)-C6 fungal-type domain-containing protein n=1 Tax=Ophiocordyceps australis TaxID=1399860 RepID=A0A2C5YSQ6_9HYPO|nr:hypothetical protein CDD82_7429 [Ophiocordyceps australis]
MASAEDEPGSTLDDAVAASLAKVAAAAAAVSDFVAPANSALADSSSPSPPWPSSRPVGPNLGQASAQSALASPVGVANSTLTRPDSAPSAASLCASTTPASSRPCQSPSTSLSPQQPTASLAPASPTNPSTVVEPRAASSSQQNRGDSAPVSEGDGNMSSRSPALPAALHGLPDAYLVPNVVSPSVYGPTAGISTGQYSSYSGTADVYRTSPVSTSAPMSLPSMRTMDAVSQSVASPAPSSNHGGSLSMGVSSLSPPVAATSPFYIHHSMVLPSGYGLGHDSTTHYSMPHDPRILGGRGPKKEIKRRTKTGCLTCRKRRIKCDETHPTCNNCRKSKRDCLGYDPIFRPQCGSGSVNSHIQPAPSSINQTHRPDTLSIACVPASNSYTGHAAIPSSAYTPSPTVSASVPTSVGYSPSIKTVSAGFPHITPVKSEACHETPSSKAESTNEQVTAAGSSRQLQSILALSESRHPAKQNQSVSSQTNRLIFSRGHGMKISEIIDSLGPPPPRQPCNCSDEMFNEITKVYHEMYAGGLGAFFESSWYYFTDNGQMNFPKDANLIEHMASFLKALEAVKANDHTQMAYSGVLETRIVWQLACTAYKSPDHTNSTMRIVLPAEGDPTEVRNRLRVVEALLCGEYLPENPLAPPVADADHHRMRQFDFWYSLAEFVRKRDHPSSPESLKSRDEMLARMRHLLDGRENRDVLYSIAVVRELAPKYEAGYGSSVPQHLDESDPKNRLAVASRFILDEAQVTGGTTNVVRRFSDIAARAFVNPGVNIARQHG